MIRKLMILAGLFMMFQFGFSLSCSMPRRYEIKENDILYSGISVKGVDKSSFKKLDINLAKDKNNIYYRGKNLKNLDLETFKVVSWYEPVPHPVWGMSCKFRYIERFRDKNGEYGIEDISDGELKLEERE
ncbi:Uncharacterised protein [Sebaldella termitidis]|uniref:Lipoprotein n=1 Tax=Sebaldella termitidis (strain ATCC 33386 / NCTC 11300) TaxID=526218 RepID=D1AR78_SEBTE|nr:DKNYY domain-containing protein [Sebaldella termitidis]ACZ07766.1 hypothetical protein Sterm_0896 [Sebaldella termitidis ATCC 33386]SUI23066.1 Uncharacterised protein [Sebaldella termitidis]